MDPSLSPLIERFAQEGASRFANWKASLFQEIGQTAAPRVWQSLEHGDSERRQAVLTAYLHLLCEGIGNGYLATGWQNAAGNLMELCLRDWLPAQLAALPHEQHLPMLASTWNLLEGLLREPPWVNVYVMARAGELDKEASLESFLMRVLKPLFEPASPAQWNGPFQVSLLSTRPGDDEFLPGDMRLVAPTILAVKDRRRAVHLGFILRKQGQSELAGAFGETAPFVEEASPILPHWQADALMLGAERIHVPLIQEPFRWLQVRAGFVVASAVNSQKLWIVESAT